MTKKQLDLAELRRVGIIQQKQKDYFAMRLRALGGDLTVEQLKKVADVSKKYGKGMVHITIRQGIEIHNVHYSDLEKAQNELAEVGIIMAACGPRVRVIVACPGASTCRWGIIDTKKISYNLDKKYFRQDTPYKFKMSVTGCPHNCAKANENDIGVMGAILPKWNPENCNDCNLCVNICPPKAIYNEENKYILDRKKCFYCSICTSSCPTDSWEVEKKGYTVWIGGTMGKFPRLGSILKDFTEDEEELYKLVDSALRYYKKYGIKNERFGHLLDRIGKEKALEEILNAI